MSTTVVVIAGCTAVTVAIKAVGPIALGGRELPLPVASVIAASAVIFAAAGIQCSLIQ